MEKTLWEGKMKIIAKKEGDDSSITFDTEELDVNALIEIFLLMDPRWRDAFVLTVIGELERMKHTILDVLKKVNEV